MEEFAEAGLGLGAEGRVGVVEEGALADLLLVDGNPLDDVGLLADPDQNLLVIMKDGTILKNKLK